MRNDDHLIFENYFKKHTENKEHTSCKYAKEGCDCDKCKECEANQAKSEDAEGLPASIEAKRKERKNIGSVRTKSEDAEDYDWNDREESDYDHGTRRHRGNGRYTDYRTGASHRDDQGPDDEDAESLSINQADWGDSYQEVKSLISQLLSYGLDKSILSGILQYAEEVGYTGESVDNLIKLIQHFNQRGVQDS